jgi:hypothetical protein
VDELLGILCLQELNHGERVALATIALLAGPDGLYDGSVRKLAKRTGGNRGALGRTMASLGRKGWLELDADGFWSVRESRTRARIADAGRARIADGSRAKPSQSARVSRTPTPPKGGVGGSRAASRGRRRPQAPRADTRVGPIERPSCEHCDSTGLLEPEFSRGWVRCPFCNPDGIGSDGAAAD